MSEDVFLRIVEGEILRDTVFAVRHSARNVGYHVSALPRQVPSWGPASPRPFLRAEHPAVAGDNAVLRVGEAKFADRGGDLRDLLVAVRARVSGVGDQRRAPAPNNRLG